jgi:hypothetical protein
VIAGSWPSQLAVAEDVVPTSTNAPPNTNTDHPPLRRRVDAADARQRLTELIASTVEPPRIAHDVAARATNSALPTSVQHLMQRRRAAVLRRDADHRAWLQTVRIAAAQRATHRARHASRSRSLDEGLEL